MTVEELDIIVQASVEGAIKEFNKLLPAVKKQLSGIQKEFNNVNIKDITTNIDFKTVTKEVKRVKKQIKDMFDPNDTSGITFTGNIGKSLDEISTKYGKLKGSSKDLYNAVALAKYRQELSKVNLELDKSPTKGKFIGYDSEKIQGFVNNYGKNNIENKEPKENNNTEKLSFWDTLKNKIAQATKMVSKFLGATKGSSGFSKMIPQLNGISGLSIKIKNQIKQWSTGFKNGLGHILKYAGALFSLRGIYSVLSNSASSWLSSQDAGAKQLTANIEYMKTAMGSALAPIIQFVTNLIYQLMRAIQSVVYAFSGINIFAKAAASSMKSTAGSAKQASKSLSSVHSEISNVSENNSSGGGGSLDPSIDLSQMDNMPSAIIDAIKNGNWYELGNIVAQKINEGLSNIPWDIIQSGARNIATAIGQGINGFIDGLDWNLLGSTIGNGINTAFIFANTFLTTINWGKIGSSIATFLNSAILTTNFNLIGTTLANKYNAIISFAYNFVKYFDWKKFGTAISDGINGFIQNIDLSTAAQAISDGIIGLLDTIKATLEGIDWVSLATDVVDFIVNIDWFGILAKLLEVIIETLTTLIGSLGVIIGGLIVEAIEGAIDYFQGKAEECGNNLFLGVLKGISDIGDSIGQWIVDHIFQPFIDGFKSAFGIHSPSTVMAEMGYFIMQGLLNGISNLVNNVTQIWINIKENIKETFNEIRTMITDVWNNVSNTTSNVWNTIVSKVKEGVSGAWNAITSTFGNVAGWFRDKFTQAWQAVKNVFSAGGAIFDGIKDGILNGLKTVINGLIQGINKVIKVPFDGLNSALNTIRNVGIGDLKPFTGLPSISIPQIPQLAKGGVLYDTTIAMIGEYAGAKSNPEIVTPQNIMYDTMRRAIEDASFFNNNSGQDIYLTLQVGDEELGQVVIDTLGNMKRRTGKGIEAFIGG